MLHIVDNILPKSEPRLIRKVCDNHAELRQHLGGDELFRWWSPKIPERA